MYEAGDLAIKGREDIKKLKVEKKSRKDLVSEIDKTIETYFFEKIRSLYPDHGFLGEETGEHFGNQYRWVIDPIDGTTSYVHGQPFFSISVALEKEQKAILAMVFAPSLQELFEAEKGKGALMNGELISVSACSILEDSVFSTGFACMRSQLEHNNLLYFKDILPAIRDIRRYGSAALDLCYVACGRLDGFWELNLNRYDVAAGQLILSEAGGCSSDFSGQERLLYHEILATNGHLHQPFSKILCRVKERA